MKTKFHRSWDRFVSAAALAAVVALQSGCVVLVVGAAGAAGAGAVAYVRGELTAALASGYEPAVRATNRAIDELQFKKVSENKDALKAVLVARTADDKRIEITLTKMSDKVTKVEIRVGVFGSENLSMTILEKIKGAL